MLRPNSGIYIDTMKRLHLVLPLALLAGLLVSPPAMAAPPTLPWKPCPDAPGAECTTMTVPVDWARPDGLKTTLSLARHRATDPARRIGSLVYNPGGPGGPGAEIVARFWEQIFSPEVLARFDVVGFDPRGVGGSDPVLCDEDVLTTPFPRAPKNRAEFAQLREHNRALGDSCRAASGPVYEHVDTGAVVRDIDAIRAALGDRRLSFLGVSYGTQNVR